MESDEAREVLQCEACGALRDAGNESADGTDVPASDVTRLVSMLPALSKKNAHSKLEELLYEHRAAIEGSEAFSAAVAAVNAVEFEMQDIKVQKYDARQSEVAIEFTYYALGERDQEQASRRFRVAGSGAGRIDGLGSVAIQDVTASVSDF